MRTPRTWCAQGDFERWGETPSSPDLIEREKKSGFEGTLTPPRFMERELMRLATSTQFKLVVEI